MDRIGPHEILAPGTRVVVQGKRGVIVGHEERRDQFGGPIVVHEIEFTERFSHRIAGVAVYRPIKRFRRKVNYSFVQLLGVA